MDSPRCSYVPSCRTCPYLDDDDDERHSFETFGWETGPHRSAHAARLTVSRHELSLVSRAEQSNAGNDESHQQNSHHQYLTSSTRKGDNFGMRRTSNALDQQVRIEQCYRK
eukprot:1336581-Amphidinium_carterae.1